MQQPQTHKEAGLVSILIVIFFMIFISLIVVAFMTIVSDDNRQSLDNDLSQSALSAARSGVEEGKRILLYCERSPSPVECTDSVLNSAQCDIFTTSEGQSIANVLSIPYRANGEVSVGGNDAYEQYLTCLTIRRDTPSITGTATREYDYVVKLRTAGAYDSLKVSWGRNEGAYSMPTGPVGNWTSFTNWRDGSTARPSVLRVQLIPYSETDFDLASPDALDELEKASRTIFIAPCRAASPPSGCTITSKDINTVDMRPATTGVRRSTQVPLTYGLCSGTSNYSCTVTLTGFAPSTTAGKTYYARVSLIYGQSADVSFSAQSAGTTVNFANVQPWIDVTGRANDVFRRVRAQVSHDSGISLPKYVIDSAAPICKDMATTNAATTSQLNCTY